MRKGHGAVSSRSRDTGIRYKFNSLVGDWAESDGSSNVVYRIECTRRRPKVVLFNKASGERAVVSKLVSSWKSLSFEAYWRSTKYRTRNILTPLSGERIELRFTRRTVYNNRRCVQSLNRHKSARGSELNTRKHLLVGYWEASDESSNVLLEITENRRGNLAVRAVNEMFSVESKVLKVRWDGEALNLETRGPLTGTDWTTRYRAFPLSGRRCLMEETEWDTLVRFSE